MSLLFCGDWLPAVACRYELSGLKAIGNLECAFAAETISSMKAYTSVLPMDRIKNVAEAGFGALSLANNHTYDAGNFEVFYRELGRQCPETLFFGTLDAPYAAISDNGLSIAVIGCLERCRSRGALLFPQEKVRALILSLCEKFDRVYVYPHWGKEGEYTRYPSPRQRRLARQWIEAGADGVFGHHSHVFQGYEIYHGKPVFYSLGNFYFPHPESRLYKGTTSGMTVAVDRENWQFRIHEFSFDGIFSDVDENILVDGINRELSSWNTWKWAKKIGGFNLRKNNASWKLRLRKNFIKTLPLYLASRVMPVNVLFWFASRTGKE